MLSGNQTIPYIGLPSIANLKQRIICETLVCLEDVNRGERECGWTRVCERTVATHLSVKMMRGCSLSSPISSIVVSVTVSPRRSFCTDEIKNGKQGQGGRLTVDPGHHGRTRKHGYAGGCISDPLPHICVHGFVRVHGWEVGWLGSL